MRKLFIYWSEISPWCITVQWKRQREKQPDPVHPMGEGEIVCSYFLTSAYRTLEGHTEAWWWLKHRNWMEGTALGWVFLLGLFMLCGHWGMFSHWFTECSIDARHDSTCSQQNRHRSAPGSLHCGKGNRSKHTKYAQCQMLVWWQGREKRTNRKEEMKVKCIGWEEADRVTRTKLRESNF